MKLDELKHWLTQLYPEVGYLINAPEFSWRLDDIYFTDCVNIRVRELGGSINSITISIEEYTNYEKTQSFLYNNAFICTKTMLVIIYNKDEEFVETMHKERKSSLIVRDLEDNKTYPIEIENYEKIDDERFRLEAIVGEC